MIKFDEQQENNNCVHLNKMFVFKESNIIITIMYFVVVSETKFDTLIYSSNIMNTKI